jgi:hypothetical protein
MVAVDAMKVLPIEEGSRHSDGCIKCQLTNLCLLRRRPHDPGVSCAGRGLSGAAIMRIIHNAGDQAVVGTERFQPTAFAIMYVDTCYNRTQHACPAFSHRLSYASIDPEA